MNKPLLNSIPPELVAKVADDVLDDLDATTPDPDARQNGIVSLTHICAKWRAQLLNSRKYWSRIFIQSVASLKDLVTRSRSAVLTITGSLDDKDGGDDAEERRKDNEEKLGLVMGVRSRLRSLCVSVSSAVLGNVVGQANGPSSVLEELEINVNSALAATNLAAFTSPVLRHLRLSGFDNLNNFAMLLIPALAELHIMGINVVTTTLNLRHSLRGLPNLTSLKLSLPLESPPNNPTNMIQSGVVSLLSLKDLYMEVWRLCDAELLCDMLMPQLMFAHVQVHDFDDLEGTIGHMDGIITGIGPTQVLRGCTMYSPNPTTLYCSFTPDPGSSTWRSQKEGLCLVFDGYGYDEETRILASLRPRLGPHISAVEYLSLDDGRAYVERSATEWREFFGLLPAVTHLRISGRYTSTLPTGIYTLDSTDGSWHPLFPKLEALRLESVWYRDGWRRIFDVVDFYDRFLKPYQSLGYPKHLTALTLIGGINIFTGDVTVLRKIFPAIEWDGVEKKDTSHEEVEQWYVPEDDDVVDSDEENAGESEYGADEENDLSEDDGDRCEGLGEENSDEDAGEDACEAQEQAKVDGEN